MRTSLNIIESDEIRNYGIVRETGYVSLLRREGEIESAKKIEQGKGMVISAIFGIPSAIREVISLGDKLTRNQVDIKDVVLYSEEGFEEDEEADYEELRIKTIHLIFGIKYTYKKYIKVAEKVNKTKSVPIKNNLKDRMISLNKDIIEKIKKINLKPNYLNYIVRNLNALIGDIDAAEKEIGYCSSKLNIVEKELNSFFKRSRFEKDLQGDLSLSHKEIEELENIYKNAKKRIQEVELESMISRSDLRHAMKLIAEGEYLVLSHKTL